MESGQIASAPLFAGVSPERRIVELTILYEVSRALQTTLDEEKALYTILAGVTAGRGLGFNRALILLVDSEEKYLQGRLATGPSSLEEAAAAWLELRENHQTLGDQLRALNETGFRKDWQVNRIVGRIQVLLEEQAHPMIAIMRSREACLASGGKYIPWDWPVDPGLLDLLGTGDFALAPLYVADKDLGILLADNAINRREIELNNLHLLQIYAQAASAAIRNTRLYNELRGKISLCEKANHALLENQDYLLQAERLSTIGKMAALLAHEIRTPLVSIGGFARRLLRSTPADDPRTEELEIIFSEVTRLERLVAEVLGYCKIAKPEYSEVDINALIQNILLTLQDEIEKNSLRVVSDLAAGLPATHADASQLRQALINLLMNALDAMPSGGSLTVTTSREGGFLEIGISDTGIGIAREYWGRLFEPFFTTKSAGTGLGLAVVSQVLENHRGSLRFESVPDEGTTFYIRLPICDQTATGQPDSAKAASAVEMHP